MQAAVRTAKKGTDRAGIEHAVELLRRLSELTRDS
jgi:hypothetical protein